MFTRLARLTVVVTTLALAACAPATPALIGAYYSDASQPIATYVVPPASLALVYDAYLELETRDPASAADRAAQLAADFGGYLSASQQWIEDGHTHATVTLAVPSAYFDSLHAAVLSLGRLQTERATGTLVSPAYPGQAIYATLTVDFRPAPPLITLPRLPGIDWSPAHTFASAFTLFAALFTFLLDLVIWLAVVVGPFALMSLGIRTVIRRWRRPSAAAVAKSPANPVVTREEKL
jgi:hypothetical protein